MSGEAGQEPGSDRIELADMTKYERSTVGWEQPEDASEPAQQTIRQLRAQRRVLHPETAIISE